MPLGSFRFHRGVGAFFEMATSDARNLLPSYLEPIEIRHQRSVLSVTAFLFDDSAVGPYTELMFSVIVPPKVSDWGRHPKVGFFPFLVASSSEQARRIKAERLYLPYCEERIDAQFIETDDWLRVRVFGSGSPILDMRVTAGTWDDTTHLLQAYTMNGDERLRATVQIDSTYTVHEKEQGHMKLFGHPMTDDLLGQEVGAYPFREHYLKNGTEVFHEMESF